MRHCLTMNALCYTIVASLVGLLSACGQEPPPARSVTELMDSPFLLEAAMVRCAEDRTKTKYDPECINAREAANRLDAEDRRERQADLEAQSERKRKALRRTQEAAAEARRRTAEAERMRQEAEYLGVFESVPDARSNLSQEVPVAAGEPQAEQPNLPGNQPGATLSPQDLQAAEPSMNEESAAELTDIDSVREELKQRQDSVD